MTNSHAPQLACILHIVCRMGHVLAVKDCVTYMCTEDSGGVVAVYLTDATPGCSSSGADYMVSKCGVGYNQTTCNVDCSGICAYSGSYWHVEGCTILGPGPCGAQGESDSSVLNVCQDSQSPTPPTSPDTPPPPSTQPPTSTGSTNIINMLSQCCGMQTCTFQTNVDNFIPYYNFLSLTFTHRKPCPVLFIALLWAAL